MASGFAAPLPAFLRLLLAVVAVLWIPGAVIVSLLRVEVRSPFIVFPLQFFTGVSVVSIVTWLLMALGVSLSAYSATLLWTLALFYVVATLVLRTNDRKLRAHWGYGALLIALALFVASQPVALDADQDAYDHIGYVRQIQASGDLWPEGVLAARVDVPHDVPADPRKGTFHDVLAVLSSRSGLDPMDMWTLLPIILFPLAFFAFLGFCRAFMNSGPGLALCALLFAFSYGGVGFQYAATVAYGQNLAIIWYWLLAALLLRQEPTTGIGLVILVAMLAAGGAFVHFGVVLHTLVLGATLVLFSRWLPAGRRAWRANVAMLVAVLLAGLWRYAFSHGDANVIHMHLQGLLYFGSWFSISPIEVLREHGLLFLGGLTALPLLWIWGRGDGRARRQLAFAAIPMVVCFMPFVTTPAVEIGTYMVSRSLLNVPVFPVIVTTAGLLIAWSRRRGLSARALVALVTIAWSLVFLAPTVRAVIRSFHAASTPVYAAVSDELIRYVRRLPTGSVILSDTKTAYALSALSGHRFVAIDGQHANPLDPDGLDRLEAVRDLLSPHAVSRRAMDACTRYAVDFVVVNAASAATTREFLSTWDASDYRLSVSKLNAISGRFRGVYEGDDFVVFLHDEAGVGETVWGTLQAPVQFADSLTWEPCRVVVPENVFDVLSVSVSPQRALPGETVTVTVVYSRSGGSGFGLPFLQHVRFDHESIGAGRDYPGAKHVRRAHARWGGGLRRLTVTRRPLDGRFHVDMWPIGREFYESFDVVLPATLETGRYSVSMTIERDSLLPNFTWRDLLYNHDRLSGTKCAEIQVVTQKVRAQ